MYPKREWRFALDELPQVSEQLIMHYNSMRLFCFEGNLGAGKTTLIKSICQYLGSNNSVSSPTFSLMNTYEYSNQLIYHFDLYRLNSFEEVIDMGIEEYIYSGEYCFIEWPEKIAKILPPKLAVYCSLNYLSAQQRILETCIK